MWWPRVILEEWRRIRPSVKSERCTQVSAATNVISSPNRLFGFRGPGVESGRFQPSIARHPHRPPWAKLVTSSWIHTYCIPRKGRRQAEKDNIRLAHDNRFPPRPSCSRVSMAIQVQFMMAEFLRLVPRIRHYAWEGDFSQAHSFPGSSESTPSIVSRLTSFLISERPVELKPLTSLSYLVTHHYPCFNRYRTTERGKMSSTQRTGCRRRKEPEQRTSLLIQLDKGVSETIEFESAGELLEWIRVEPEIAWRVMMKR